MSNARIFKLSKQYGNVCQNNSYLSFLTVTLRAYHTPHPVSFRSMHVLVVKVSCILSVMLYVQYCVMFEKINVGIRSN